MDHIQTLKYLFLHSIMNYYGNVHLEYYYSALNMVPTQFFFFFSSCALFFFFYFSWWFLFVVSKSLYFFEYKNLCIFVVYCVVLILCFFLFDLWTYGYDILLKLFWKQILVYEVIFDINGDAYLLWFYLLLISFVFCVFIFIFAKGVFKLVIENVFLFIGLRLSFFTFVVFFVVFLVPDAVLHIVLLVGSFILFEILLFVQICMYHFTFFCVFKGLRSEKVYQYIIKLINSKERVA